MTPTNNVSLNSFAISHCCYHYHNVKVMVIIPILIAITTTRLLLQIIIITNPTPITTDYPTLHDQDI